MTERGTAELDETKALIAELRKEREAAERTLNALQDARTSPRPAARRAEIQRTLERPREPKGALEGYDPDTARKLVYAGAGGIGAFFLIALLLILL